jgi:hypothetical protein
MRSRAGAWSGWPTLFERHDGKCDQNSDLNYDLIVAVHSYLFAKSLRCDSPGHTSGHTFGHTFGHSFGG